MKIKSQLLPILAVTFILFIMVPADQASAQKKKNRKKQNMEMADQGIILADNGISQYRIVLPAFATESEKKAASVLQDYLLQISNTALPVIPSDKSRSPYEIVLGQNGRLDEINAGIDLSALESDGFIILTDSARLIIAGGNGKGTLYGVYTFLDKYLGCRMYSPTVKVIPKLTKIVISSINDMEVPKIRYRYIHYKETWDQEYADWHKLSQTADGERPAWGAWVHTFNHLVPPEIYFKDHPEYYALRNGERAPTQLCLSNPEVLKIVIQNLRKWIAKNPDAKYWSVSQNDNREYCTCDQCKALDEREGSPSGSIINFVNQVAAKFPDKVISTLAYEYGRKAPRNIKPAKNVNIMLCSIEVNRDLPIDVAQDSVSLSFVKDVNDWGKIADDIIVWDYVIQFNNLISPFPNFQVLKPNLQFFTKHGVTAMFEQGNREKGGEFAELRSYLLAELEWNPDADVSTLMNDFLTGYYGPAGIYIRQYIDLMRDSLLKSGQPLRIFNSPVNAETSYLTPSLIDKYSVIFNEALAAVDTMPEVLERVKIARLPLQFAIMEQAKSNYTGEHGIFIKENGQWVIRHQIRTMIDPFVDLCIREGATRIKEWSTTPEAYRASMYRLFTLGMKEHLAYEKKVTFISPDTASLPDNAGEILTDGKRGGHDPYYNWLSFSGKDLDVIVDLGQVQKVKHIESAYYQLAAWMTVLPAQVEYSVSTDGKKFQSVDLIKNDLPIDQYDAFQRGFISDFNPVDARYVRVKAKSIISIPANLFNGGRPANMRVDEILVE